MNERSLEDWSRDPSTGFITSITWNGKIAVGLDDRGYVLISDEMWDQLSNGNVSGEEFIDLLLELKQLAGDQVSP